MSEPTARQREIFDFVAGPLREGRHAPTLREIAEAFGFSGTKAVEDHMAALIRKGWLEREEGKARPLRLGPASGPLRASIVDIPVFGTIPAGYAADRRQEADGCISVDVATLGFKPGPRTFALRVSGDSMVGKHIVDGDIVVLEHGADPRPGQIVAALIDGKSTLKTYVKARGKAWLRAENPKYPDMVPAEELMIQGVVRTIVRQL
jgi:repressor LexA